MRAVFRFAIHRIVFFGVAYLAFCGGAFLLQRHFLYFPNATLPAPAQAGLGNFSVVTIETADGLKLLAWWMAPPGAEAPVVVLFHGNAGSIADRAFKAAEFAAAGFGMLLVEYRGYGGNPGRPHEAGLYADARAAARFLEGESIARKRWALYGESLGGGPAVQLAQELALAGGPVGAVILESAFTATADVAAVHYWFLPVRLIVSDRFDNAGKIASIAAPLLILHGARDDIVPPAHARRLYELAREPKTLTVFDIAGHNDLWGRGAAQAATRFIRSVVR